MICPIRLPVYGAMYASRPIHIPAMMLVGFSSRAHLLTHTGPATQVPLIVTPALLPAIAATTCRQVQC